MIQRSMLPIFRFTVTTLFYYLLLFLFLLLTVGVGAAYFSGYLDPVATTPFISYEMQGESGSLVQKENGYPKQSLGKISDIPNVPALPSSDASYVLLGQPNSSTLFFGIKQGIFDSELKSLFRVNIPDHAASTSTILTLIAVSGDGKYGAAALTQNDKETLVVYDLLTDQPLQESMPPLTVDETMDPGCSTDTETVLWNMGEKTLTVGVYLKEEFPTCRPLLRQEIVPLTYL